MSQGSRQDGISWSSPITHSTVRSSRVVYPAAFDASLPGQLGAHQITCSDWIQAFWWLSKRICYELSVEWPRRGLLCLCAVGTGTVFVILSVSCKKTNFILRLVVFLKTGRHRDWFSRLVLVLSSSPVMSTVCFEWKSDTLLVLGKCIMFR